MTPLRKSRLLRRYEEEIEIAPLKRFFLIFEGENTEKKYFKGIKENKKELGISAWVEIESILKEGNTSSYSAPKKLLEIANEKKEEYKKIGKYDEEIDCFVIIFDRDSFDSKNEYQYLEYIEMASENNILAITSPCFEIWLFLHYEEALETHIFPNKEKIIENAKVSNLHTYISHLFSEKFKMNTKKTLNFSKLKNGLDLAIEQEKRLIRDNSKMFNQLGSNIGQLIKEMRKDPRKAILS